jgi:hypothetical protein
MNTATAPTAASSRDKLALPGGMALPVVGVAAAILLIVVGSFLGRQRDEQLPTAYGKRRGGEAGRSVNGTAVLADMFRQADNRVTTLSRFSPKLEQFDVIVWFPNDFKPPDEEHRQKLEDWLANGSSRTLVYVGRDYNAAIDYWQRVAPAAPPAQADEVLRRQAEARSAWEAARSRMPEKEYARWFTARRDEKPRKVDHLSGPWAEGIDPKQADIRIEGRLSIPSLADTQTASDETPALQFETLLASGADPVVTRVSSDPADKWGDGQILVIANGSFLLNYPLVNHEHRKLAARLVEECGTGHKVVFIESDAEGPRILSKEPTGGFPTALELLKVWPLNAILLHLTVLGIVLCLARSPIFGRPRELPADSPSDFGKHVAALGKLLARTKDRNYAQARLLQYRQLAQRRSGRSHAK